MNEIRYRILESFILNGLQTRQETWLSIHDTMSDPEGDVFDQNFDTLLGLQRIQPVNDIHPSGHQMFAITEKFGKRSFKLEKASRKKPFRENYWWVIAILTYATGLLSPSLSKLIEKEIAPPSTQSEPPTQQSIDTVYQNR